MTGECDDVDDPEVGVSFDCTGTTDDGDVVEFVTLIDDDDHISVDSVNLVTAEGVPQYEAAAAEALTEQAGVTLDPADVDCGDDPRHLRLVDDHAVYGHPIPPTATSTTRRSP